MKFSITQLSSAFLVHPNILLKQGRTDVKKNLALFPEL